ncbi:MAG TPA: hydrogenase expression/formation protein HypE [Tepidisphaeraceae bacterium]|nr:hydrogenase expression/formation protein HypE [Tepidisphaeraceae bacterium]
MTAASPSRKTSSTGSRISLAHGGGGQLTDELFVSAILPRLGNSVLNDLLDSAQFAGAGRLAMTIDSYIVQPLKFPGGDIGRLCISGTVNDLAVCGARPLGIALSLILTEGLDRQVLEDVLDSIAATANLADVKVVTGDTKVVGHGHGDGIYITTAGVGAAGPYVLHPSQVRPGDVLIISGPIADHGMAVMLARQMPHVKSAVRSDVAPLNHMIADLLEGVPGVVFLRDPTRGGLAGVAADLAARTGLHITLNETDIPVRPQTLHAADMLGIDPLDVANEGKIVVVVRPDSAAQALEALREDKHGKEACIVGSVGVDEDGICELRTSMGGRRILQKPYGEQLPRIC